MSSIAETFKFSLQGNVEDVPLLTGAWSGAAPVPVKPSGYGLDHIRANRVGMREHALAETNAALDSAVAGVKDNTIAASQRALSAWNVARNAVMKSVNVMALGASKTLDSTARSVGEMSYRRNFPELAKDGATFVAAFDCKALHGGVCVSGSLYVTSTHLCFHNGDRIAASYALCDVVSVNECIALATYDGRPFLCRKPTIDPEHGMDVQTDAVQIFMKDRRLIEVINVVPSKTDAIVEVGNSAVRRSQGAKMCLVSLWEVWEKAVPSIPVPGVEYTR